MHFDLWCLKNGYFDLHQFFWKVWIFLFGWCEFDFGTVMGLGDTCVTFGVVPFDKKK